MKKYLFIALMLFFSMISCQEKQDWSYPSVFWGFAFEGFPITQQMLSLQEQDNMIAPEAILFYLNWPSPLQEQESIVPSLEAIWSVHAVPCLTWEPMLVGDKREMMIPYEDILEGQYDEYLLFMASEIKRWGKPLIIRLAHEMNISRYHWGTTEEDFGPDSPIIYIRLFQYVVDLFKKEKVSNVFWAFCPNSDSIPNEGWNSASKYYPGDQYVDILGMDGYNWDINEELAASRQQSWTSSDRSFEQIFKPLYQELKAIAPQKPIIIFETATVIRSAKGSKSLWIKDALKTAKSWNIKGIVWFEVEKEENWEINQNNDYSYMPLIQKVEPTFQAWLLNFTRDNVNRAGAGARK